MAINSESLNVRESAAKSIYQSYGQTVTIIDNSNADYNTLKNYDLSVATENGAITQTVVNSLIENGEKVLLLNLSGLVLGGTWASYTTSNYHSLLVESNSIFLDGYMSNYSFEIQSTELSYFISANYPSGWSIVGRNAQNSSYKTVLYKTHSSGGKGLIFTYSPESITSIGQNFYDLLFKWLTGIDAFSSKTVPTGNVAFIISGYDDDDSPTLSTREAALNAKLREYGYNMTYIRSGRLQQSNVDNAALIVAVDYPSIDKYTIEDELNDGENVALYYSSAAVLGGSWNNYNTSNYHNLKVDANEIFLDGYKSFYSIDVQDDYSAYYISASYPSGWTNIGRNIQNKDYKTMFYKTTSNGGKGLIFTYNPENISSQGKNIYDRIYKWFKGTAAYSGKTVSTGNVAFIISGYDDDDSPELSTREAALKAKLENYGYNLTFIRSSRLPESNISAAKMIVAVDYPSIDKYTIDGAIVSGQNVWLHYSSASVLGGEWSFYNTSNYHALVIGSNTEFLEGLTSFYGFSMQGDLTAQYISSAYPSGWTVLGNNIQNTDYKTVFSKTHLSGGKGLIMTYNPESITNAGLNLYDKIYHWFEGSYKYQGKTIPSNNIAFVIQGYDDDNSPGLTTRETAMKSKLEAKGYNITFLKYSLIDNSDFSGASMIVAVEYPSLSKNKIEDLLADGKNVSLFWQSGSVLGGNWDSYNTTNYRTLYIESNTQYLSDYQNGDEVVVQSSGDACYISSSYPTNWTVLGRNKQNTSYKTVFSYNNVGKGLIYTYNPEYFSADGNLVFDDIEEWSETENDDLGKSILYNPYHQATEVTTSPKFTWSDVDDATSYQIQVATNATFSNIVVDKNISNNDYDESTLNIETKYYWRVRAKNTSTTGIWSEVSEFTTSSSECKSGSNEGNLVINPSCELPLVNGEIPNWEEVIGTTWGRETSGSAHDGNYYFYAGANSHAELQQFVDMSAFANDIDNQIINFYFDYWHRSYVQSPPDESKIILEFWNSNKSSKLDTFDFSYQNQTTWTKQFKYLTLPINTRWVKVRLISKRNTGTNNDGYIDDITFKVSDEDFKPLSVKVYLDGLWDGTSHSTVPVSVELRNGSSLMNSNLSSRKTELIQSNGTVLLNFADLADGDYWVVVRSAGYLPLGSTSKITLSSTQSTYNFTDAESKSAGGNRAVIVDNGNFLMRSGDLNFDMKTNSTDALLFINNNGKSVSSYVPAP